MTNKQLTDLQPGQKYYVQVRAKSKTDPDVQSDWSKAFAFTTTNDLVAPKPVSNLTFVSEGTSFIAKWDAPTLNADNSTLRDLKGYFVKIINADNTSQFSDQIYTPEKSFTLTFDGNKDLFGDAKGHLTIEVRAVDHIGNQSTIVDETAQNPVPANVTGLVAEDMIEAISVNWDANAETDIHHYELYVSTVSSGFTPGPGNRRYAGPNTSFLITSGNPVPHYIKVVAVDIFGQPSATPALVTETPRTTTSSDGTPPGAPTAVTAASSTDGVTAQIELSWTAPADADLDHYVVRYATDTTNWSYIAVPGDVTSAVIRNVIPNTPYYVGVQSVDFSANTSGFANATSYPYTTALDTTAPNKPSPPTVATSVLKAQITHDMNDDSAVDLAADTEYIEVYADTTSGFTCQPGNQVTKIKTAGVGVSVSELVVYPTATDLYWKVIAVDTAGNKSVASDATLGTPSLITNSFIENATITDAKIANLSATKLVAGTAFINDLFIRSDLTIDDANGSIASDDYNVTNKTGWKIDRNGIVIYEGSVKAPALEIQDSQNLVSAAFADFEFNNDYYFTSANLPNTLQINTSAGTSRLDKVLTGNKYGTQHIKFYDTTGAANNWLYLAPTSTSYNIPVDGGNTYILSIWVKNNLGSAKTFDFAVLTDSGQTFTGNQSIASGGTWTRVSLVCATNISATKVLIRLGSAANTPIDFGLDGIQFERKIAALDTPSPWTPPGATTISGESIVTGSIRSSATASGIPTQPAWSLNTAGNAQFGDALVRGNLTVGAGADLANSTVKSSNYAAGTTGWQIKGDGSVEFNSGTFRGDLNIERTVSSLTTRLKASVGDQRIQTIVGTTPTPTTIQTPALSGQHYGYTRTSNGAGWFLPATPSADRKMRYFFGPSTDRSVVLQTNTKDVDAIYMGVNAENIPRNAQINSFQIGEIIDYKVSQAEKESTGFMHYSSGLESTGTATEAIPYTFRHTPSGGNLTPVTENQSYISQQGITKQLSQFAPEYLGGANSKLTDFYSGSGWVVESANANTFIQSNLLVAPYDETVHSTLTFDNVETLNDLVGTGAGQVASNSSTNMKITATTMSGMFDSNYKTPGYMVDYSVTTNANTFFFFSTNDNPNVVANVHSLRRGKRYVLSIFVKTDYPTSPVASFNMTLGLRCQTTGATFEDNSGLVTVLPGKASQRVSVAITLPAGAIEYEKANLYVLIPGSSTLNRRIGLSHPQVEEKIWSIHSNPNVAASDLPTAWKPNKYTRQATNKAGILVKSIATPDLRYDAYGRNARGNQLYWDINSYQTTDYKAYREAPSYIDLYMLRDSRIYSGANVPYNGDQGSARYRFSEAGLQFPTSFEPYMPAGVQAQFSTRVLPAGFGGGGDSSINLTEHAYSTEEIILGNDIRRLSSTTSYVVDKAGWYLMYCTCVVDSSGPDAIWFKWKVTNAAGTFDLGYNGVHRPYTWETSTLCLRFLQRDDAVTLFMYSAAANAAAHNINNIVFAMARIN